MHRKRSPLTAAVSRAVTAHRVLVIPHAAIPLIVHGDALGALNIYCYREYGCPATDERLAAALGPCASAAVARARTYWRVARLADQLQQTSSPGGVVELGGR